jgi:site-specific DNA-methyltransferase (adenine-specific)
LPSTEGLHNKTKDELYNIEVKKLIKLLHGDCLELMKDIPDKSIDAIITDPPYKLSQSYSSNVDADNLIAVSNLYPMSKIMIQKIKKGGIIALFYDVRILPFALKCMEYHGWKYLRTLTLYRRWGNAHQLHGWMSTSDHILIFCEPSQKAVFQKEWKHDVYIKDKKEKEGFGHPAQKPLFCIEHIVQNICPKNGIILDCWMGSGTTGVACINTNRNFIGIEKEENYYNIAEERINKTIQDKKNSCSNRTK